MPIPLRTIFVSIFCALAACQAADVSVQRLQTTTARENGQPTYYWKTNLVGEGGQLLTLFCRGCQPANVEPLSVDEQDQPLLSVLRDSMGDANPRNDRVLYVWLLSYSHIGLGRRMLSAVPFFYWRVGDGSKSVSARDTAPLFDLTAPQHPVTSELGRDLLQWTAFDPMTTPVRATSRAYRSNQVDYERVHLEEAVTYLRKAPVSEDNSALTQSQLNTVVARLELRKRLLGGLVAETRAARIGEESGFEQERIRNRNWELLRQCAERTGLYFEPLDLAGTTGDYALIWFPLHESAPPAAASLAPVWKLLHMRNPWSDVRLSNWKGPVYTRALDENGALLAARQIGARQIQLVPLAAYSLSYPKLPLLLVDFRDKLHLRWHEMMQRSINEITAGVIGISHFTNWYYYVAADLYDFVVERHGAAMNQAARLDCYSQFRIALALDFRIDARLRTDMQSRINSLALNPLEATPARELQAAKARYARLSAEAEDGKLVTRLDKERRAELAYFEESPKARIVNDLMHNATLGLYTHRAKRDPQNLATLDAYRRIEYHLQILDSLLAAGTQPEVAYDRSRIEASVDEVSGLVPEITSAETRAHVVATLRHLRDLSRDENLQADCSRALLALQNETAAARAASGGIAASRRGIGMPSPIVNALK